MKAILSRALMMLAICCFDARHGEWAAAMRVEFEVAVLDGRPFRFAVGCLAAAWRQMLTSQDGWFTLTSYALSLGLIMPMAALHIGCALFGLPYLYPGQTGLAGALLEGAEHERLLRTTYQGAIPALALVMLMLGLGHLRLAWAMLDRDWERARRLGMALLAAALTLLALMGVLFLNGVQALFQGAVLAIELVCVAMVAGWHAGRCAASDARHRE